MVYLFQIHSILTPPRVLATQIHTCLYIRVSTNISEQNFHRFMLFIFRPQIYSDTVSRRIDRWIVIHFILMFICIIVHYAPSISNMLNEMTQWSFLTNNRTLVNKKYLDWSHYGLCSRSSSRSFYIYSRLVFVINSFLK